jgi:GPH family glycoside/pentoside/hexuronide:cation symporter
MNAKSEAMPSTIAAAPPDAAARDAAVASRLTLGTCLGFGVGTVGVSVMLNAVTAYFPAFMSTVLGQSTEIAGLLLMVSKLYDAVADVVIGTLSDRTRSRWGRRRPYLLAGALLSSISFLMLFTPAQMSEGALLAYMTAALILYSTGYSLFNVPYMAMPSEMCDGFDERTRLISFRTVFVSIGQLLALAGTAALIRAGGGGAPGYRIMALVMALVIFGAMVASFFGTARARSIPRNENHKRGISWSEAVQLFRNRPFAMLVGAKVFQFLSFASAATCGLLFMLNVLHIGYTGQIHLSVCMNLTVALSMPMFVKLGARIGKRKTYLAGVALYAAGALSWLAADASITTVEIWARGIVSGLGSGAIILMSISMLGDTMAYDRRLTGLHREGLMSSVIAVVEKTSFAFGVAIVGLLLKWVGYVPTTGGALVQQPDSAVFGLYAGYAIVPAAMFALNGFFMYLYDLDEKKFRDALKQSA